LYNLLQGKINCGNLNGWHRYAINMIVGSCMDATIIDALYGKGGQCGCNRVHPSWMDEMEKMVGVGGVQVHRMWMDVMEKVVGVDGIQVQPLWMDGMGKMVGVGGDKPP
jgi:hypothetical protein